MGELLACPCCRMPLCLDGRGGHHHRGLSGDEEEEEDRAKARGASWSRSRISTSETPVQARSGGSLNSPRWRGGQLRVRDGGTQVTLALPSPHVPGGLAEAEVGQLQERTRAEPTGASGHLRIRGVCKTSSSHRQQGLQLLKSQLSASDGRSRPPSHTLWSVCCVPRPLQQVQANRQRVERRQPRLHGALHTEQGREQEARQKCG